ncbi:MAG: YgiQ family radical SAM protein [Clostridia bacterium]|nr:YgiQ family radical SAM protein [Clostridia bacterium]
MTKPVKEEPNTAAPRPLPLTPDELYALSNVRTPDFVIVSGDAYIDHPSFGTAIIGRVLLAHGYSVGIIAQPDWRKADSVKVFGRPRLGFLVNSGNMDSMVNKYTVAKKPRGTDAYTPGGVAGKRPDRAVNVYCSLIRKAYGSVPIVIGGIEASLRRFAHYDYWDNRVLPSILVSSGADLLVYGMGERQTADLAEALDGGLDIHDITYIPGTAYLADDLERVYEYSEIESFEAAASDKAAYCRAFLSESREQDAIAGKRLVQKHGEKYLVVNPPAAPLTTEELDEVYDLPYTRLPHPSYKEHIPAIDEVQFSLVSCRGCYGQCSFCALTFHQGRVIQARSHASLIREAKLLTKLPGFKGYIHDVGGPTANFRFPACKKQLTKGVCKDRSCLGYTPCKNVEVDHRDYVELLRKLRKIEGVKKVFVRSGIRYDYLMYDNDDTFIRELIKHHVSGQLKVAPEHIDDRVLEYMNKPGGGLYERFVQKYMSLNKSLGMEQYIVPYFMSSHPGSTLQSAIALAEYLKKSGQRPEQVQDFYPTPGTLSTCMFYTGMDPRTMKSVYIPRSPKEKAMQRALMQFFIPKNRPLVREALRAADRDDLIGYGKNCLVPPEREEGSRGTGRQGEKRAERLSSGKERRK